MSCRKCVLGPVEWLDIMGLKWCRLRVGTGRGEDLAHTSLPSCGFAAMGWTAGWTAIVAAVLQENTWGRCLLNQLVFMKGMHLSCNHVLGSWCHTRVQNILYNGLFYQSLITSWDRVHRNMSISICSTSAVPVRYYSYHIVVCRMIY